MSGLSLQCRWIKYHCKFFGRIRVMTICPNAIARPFSFSNVACRRRRVPRFIALRMPHALRLTWELGAEGDMCCFGASARSQMRRRGCDPRLGAVVGRGLGFGSVDHQTHHCSKFSLVPARTIQIVHNHIIDQSLRPFFDLHCLVVCGSFIVALFWFPRGFLGATRFAGLRVVGSSSRST